MKKKHILEIAFANEPLRTLKGLSSAFIAYPIAESRENRQVRPKLDELRKHYKMPMDVRRQKAIEQLVNILTYARNNVPYYKDLFLSIKFDPLKVGQDIQYLEKLPILTKEIIIEQGKRMLAHPLEKVRHYACKTGGSTGLSCVIYYNQVAADYSSAVTLYARERIGKYKFRSELHFACRFPDVPQPKWPSREDFKCFAMNRSNIFFDRIDDVGLEEIWQTLKRRRPYLVHGHPSTIYALACYIDRRYGGAKAFDVFESSGELLQDYQREMISHALKCRVIDRYGLAELGVMAYEVNGHDAGMQVLESEGWPESLPVSGSENNEHELIFTGFRNRLMPLIRYRTGDLARVVEREDGFYLTDIVGRIHDMVPINGIAHATHHIQDILDHRVGGIQEFQIDNRLNPPVLKIVPEKNANPEEIKKKITGYWKNGFTVQFVTHDDFVRVGRHSKFRHVVQNTADTGDQLSK